MKKFPNQIAIDGTAASGKTTVGKIVANKLGYLFFDTGIMYRVAAYGANLKLHDVSDEAQVSALVEAMNIELANDEVNKILLSRIGNGETMYSQYLKAQKTYKRGFINLGAGLALAGVFGWLQVKAFEKGGIALG